MILYLDTADLNEIEKYSFLIDGVTTTPTIIKRSGITSEDFMSTVRKRFPHLDIHVEALGKTAKDTEELIQDFCDKSWYKADKVAFKVPICREGLKAAKMIKQKYPTVRINLHMAFSAAQATLAMHAGADFIAPLIGRYADAIADLDAYGKRARGNDAGYDLLDSIVACKQAIGSNAVILASSIRTVHDFVVATELFSDAITLPPHVLQASLEHPMTTEGVEQLWRDID